MLCKNYLSFYLFIAACNEQPPQQTDDTITSNPAITENIDTAALKVVKADTVRNPRLYSNARFRQVKVKPLSPGTFEISGEAQIFEAVFNWVIEDGHNQLQKGFESTDAGAPAWGKFTFAVSAKKLRANSTITLILFESSAQDGSPQHELPIPLF